MVNNMPEQQSLFSDVELFDAFTRMKKCLRCNRKLHADKAEQFRTRIVGLCYRCIDAFNKSSHWKIETFLKGEATAADEFVKEAEAFEAAIEPLRPVQIESRLIDRIGVREWGLPTLSIPGQIWRSEERGTISCMLPHPTDETLVRIDTRELEVIEVGEFSWMPDEWRSALWSYVQNWWTSGCHLGPFLAISDDERGAFLQMLAQKLADSDSITRRHIAHSMGQFAALDF